MRKLTLFICLVLGTTCPALPGPLHDAAFGGDIDEVKRLIAQGADVNAKKKGSPPGATPLHGAAVRVTGQ